MSAIGSERMPHVTPAMRDGIAGTIGLLAFHDAMKQRLAEKRAEGWAGWNNDIETEALEFMLRKQIERADLDPVDIANYAMMVWNRREMEKRFGPPPR